MSKSLAIALALSSALAASAPTQQTPDLQGLWGATLRFGPDTRGTLLIYRTSDGWRADIAGFTVPVRVDGDTSPLSPTGRGGQGVRAFAFELPDHKGSFRGGHWIQPERFATPVRLEPDGKDRWRGTVSPLENRLTFYLPITRDLHTYLRNPERNAGIFTRVSRVEVIGKDVRLIGPRDTVQGRYDDGVITVPLRGSTYDFTRVTDSSSSPFYPRGRPAPRYRYTAPLDLDDGWPVATIDAVGISRDQVERLMQQLLDMPMDSLNTIQIHSLLIARHGKLVVEEYFHGYHRDLPHDTRSASKSWTATLIGAAMQAGVPLRVNTPVYQTMLDTVPANLDPRKRAMTLEHLLTMTAGFNCDEDDPTSADEDQMNDQDSIVDWYRHTLDVRLISAPGEKIFYCSAEPNVAAGMLATVAREHLPEMFERLIARPLHMRNYHLGLTPLGEAYGGGGHRFRPRDFLKFAQLMVNEGRWEGKQIVSREWARQSTSPLRDFTPTLHWGYLWNAGDYLYQGRRVRAFWAGGNGGQVFMGIPELDLVIGFTGGNYNDRVRFSIPDSVLRVVN
jgi:CubicO group peptidase (beta-lactamase class C family)